MSGRRYPLQTIVKTPKGGDYTLPPFVTQELFDSAISYQVQPDDLVVATYPKNGTTWMLYILHMLYGRCQDFAEGDSLFKHYASLDFIGSEKTKEMTPPRLVKTHFGFDIAPWNDEAKYIFVARNPKDVVVSFFYHTVGFDFYHFSEGKFDDFYDLFVNGQNSFGNYFEMVPKWWQESQKRENIHFLLYEDLKSNFQREVLKIADFLGGDYREQLLKNDGELLKEIHTKSDIKTMKGAIASFSPIEERPAHLPFTRKGVIGDWKNVLTEDQSQLIDHRLQEAGRKYPGFDQLWQNYRKYL